MRLEVIQILDPVCEKVFFRSPEGQGWGYWKGSDPPHLGEYDVELEIPEEVKSWRRIGSEEILASRAIGAGEKHVSITGFVLGIGESGDPIVELRVGSGIVLVEIPERRSEIGRGDAVSLDVSRIEIYPYLL